MTGMLHTLLMYNIYIMWWSMFLVSVLKRQKQMNIWAQNQPALQSSMTAEVQRNPASKKTSKHPTNQQNNQTNKLKTVFITWLLYITNTIKLMKISKILYFRTFFSPFPRHQLQIVKIYSFSFFYFNW